MNAYEYAKQKFAKHGIDTEKALEILKNKRISMHCWQGDDIAGFEGGSDVSGGIQVTGNHPGAAQNPEQLMADIDKALSFIPGKHRINLHAIYAITDKKISRDKLLPEHFENWIKFAKERDLKLDFNPTLFGNEMVKDGLTLSSPDENVRRYWIDHCKASRKIAEYIGRELNDTCLCNLWIPDGLKEVPADRLGPRKRLKESLDEIFSVKLDPEYIVDSVESKVFGIGVESYTVGSHEFYLNYAAKNNLAALLDNGHYHPTEVVSDKLSSMYLFSDKVALHVTRGVRWDSDHVVSFDDELKEMAKEIIRCDALDRTLIGLDYFDASRNRISSWVVGMRNMQKALLFALLQPVEKLKKYQDEANYTELFALSEELKLYPYGEVWDEFCRRNGVPEGEEWIAQVLEYEKETLTKR